MTELNQSLYQASYQTLIEHHVPEYLADAVSRIVATDDPSQHNLGRNEIDTELAHEVVVIINNSSNS